MIWNKSKIELQIKTFVMKSFWSVGLELKWWQGKYYCGAAGGGRGRRFAISTTRGWTPSPPQRSATARRPAHKTPTLTLSNVSWARGIKYWIINNYCSFPPTSFFTWEVIIKFYIIFSLDLLTNTININIFY